MSLAVTAAFDAVVVTGVVQLDLVNDKVVLAGGCALYCKPRLVTVDNILEVPYELLAAGVDRPTVPPFNLFMAGIGLMRDAG